MPSKTDFIPFHTLEEIQYHLTCSEALIDIVISDIQKMRYADRVEHAIIEQKTIKSLNVLNEGFANMIKSLKEGYIK